MSALPGPYAAQPHPDGVEVTPAVLNLARTQVHALLESAPAFRQVPPEQRRKLAYNLVKVAAYTAALLQEEFVQSERLGQRPVLRSAPDVLAPFARAAAEEEPPPPPPPQADEFNPRAANQVARVTQDTLNAIAFPTFVADLIKGAFQAIVDASIQQMEAFGELLANVAKTVDQFESSNITDNQARDFLASSYPAHFRVDATGDAPVVRAIDTDRAQPDLRGDLGLAEDVSIDDDTAEDVLVPAARRKLAQDRHQLLSTMVLMGMQRIVVTGGRIRAQMGFRIAARDHARAASASEFDVSHDSVAGSWFGFGGAAQKTSIAYVSSSQKQSEDDLDVSASLTGEVDLKFKTDHIPLERFADTGAIMQIQGNTPNPSANKPVTGSGNAKQSEAAS